MDLEFLNQKFESDKFEFVVIYGRRRVGKTELIKKFLNSKPHIYYLASEEPSNIQLEKFVENVADYLGERPPKILEWEELFQYLNENLGEDRLVIAIDEFPYLVNSYSPIPSLFQKLVDEYLKQTKIMLILCGSSISVMESEVLGGKSPLYGRRTGQIDLHPFPFSTARKMIDKEFEKQIEIYSILGGTPLYLQLFDYSMNLKENLLENVTNERSMLYREPEFLLKEELRKPSRYMSVLESIALGNTTQKHISDKVGIPPGTLTNYLKKLQRLRLINREVPITEQRKKSKKSIYKISDNFFNFWFKFIEPSKSSVEKTPEKYLESKVLPQLPDFVSGTFEDVSQEALWILNNSEDLPFKVQNIGRWWHKENEIDIVALSENKALFAECKWTKKPIGRDVLNRLKDKSEHVGEFKHKHYALFTKSGFSNELANENVLLYDLENLEAVFKTGES